LLFPFQNGCFAGVGRVLFLRNDEQEIGDQQCCDEKGSFHRPHSAGKRGSGNSVSILQISNPPTATCPQIVIATSGLAKQFCGAA
jgi:hypothetical protein